MLDLLDGMARQAAIKDACFFRAPFLDALGRRLTALAQAGDLDCVAVVMDTRNEPGRVLAQLLCLTSPLLRECLPRAEERGALAAVVGRKDVAALVKAVPALAAPWGRFASLRRGLAPLLVVAGEAVVLDVLPAHPPPGGV